MKLSITLGESISIGEHAVTRPLEQKPSRAHAFLDRLADESFKPVLFIDHESLALGYFNGGGWWQAQYARVLAVEASLAKVLRVDFVPQWRWYAHGKEIYRITGTPDEEVLLKIDDALRIETNNPHPSTIQ